VAQLTELGKTKVKKEFFVEKTVLFGKYVMAGTD
jgi:hypothetical protein